MLGVLFFLGIPFGVWVVRWMDRQAPLDSWQAGTVLGVCVIGAPLFIPAAALCWSLQWVGKLLLRVLRK